jgi:hypothetical protein
MAGAELAVGTVSPSGIDWLMHDGVGRPSVVTAAGSETLAEQADAWRCGETVGRDSGGVGDPRRTEAAGSETLAEQRGRETPRRTEHAR